VELFITVPATWAFADIAKTKQHRAAAPPNRYGLILLFAIIKCSYGCETVAKAALPPASVAITTLSPADARRYVAVVALCVRILPLEISCTDQVAAPEAPCTRKETTPPLLATVDAAGVITMIPEVSPP
jgi:hypothetical protein